MAKYREGSEAYIKNVPKFVGEHWAKMRVKIIAYIGDHSSRNEAGEIVRSEVYQVEALEKTNRIPKGYCSNFDDFLIITKPLAPLTAKDFKTSNA